MFSIEYLRSFKIYHMAIFDLVISYLGVYLLSPILIRIFNIFHFHTTKRFWMWMTLPLSIPIHLAVNTQTSLTNMFLDKEGFFAIKLLIFIMTIMGIRQIIHKKGKK